jgi:hypothetical protein
VQKIPKSKLIKLNTFEIFYRLYKIDSFATVPSSVLATPSVSRAGHARTIILLMP